MTTLRDEVERIGGKKITIIGGNGKMGLMMRRQFEGMGAEVNIVDAGVGSMGDAADSDVVIISVPILSVGPILKEVDSVCREDALIFDISSIKSPVVEDLKAMAERRKVCSVHPMFGPSAASMSGRNVLVCGCGCEKAVSEAAELFGSTGANIVKMDIGRHDELAAYILGLSHAYNITFFTALRECGIPFEELEQSASTTFIGCLDSCIPVSEEDPLLYYNIQHLNVHSESMWDIYEKALAKVKAASLSDDPKEFIRLMESGREYLGQ